MSRARVSSPEHGRRHHTSWPIAGPRACAVHADTACITESPGLASTHELLGGVLTVTVLGALAAAPGAGQRGAGRDAVAVLRWSGPQCPSVRRAAVGSL
jgi:hypothetical protein